MNGDTLHSIGDLARRTGLTVKAIRFYADCGIVPPTRRSPAGYRRYGAEAVARLELVRTLRDLGLDLPTIRRVVDEERPLAEVAAAQAEALAVQIRLLHRRHAVLTAVARRGSTPQEMDLMHRLAKLTEAERRRLAGDFLDAVFGGLYTDPRSAGITRSLTPELPENPAPEQVEARIELAELCQDMDFRTAVRRLAELYAQPRADGGRTGLRSDLVAAVREQAGPAPAAGIGPASAEGGPVVSVLPAECAATLGRPADEGLRRHLLEQLESAHDPRRERYLRLLAVVNGWPAPESLAPVFDWSLRALRIPAAR
ncbi:MerR family transcriptional regulator [Kitasatospora herbaricolor]|uniref:MerR family transcriptional regulator n=1 Tax=Kitasatospora herbaricolor TaxID=68217 RepID=A0ABZ1WJH1_9ACTN|nr:MerR family transcriptional regulator [Kitasatospora herbaricolor]